MVDEANRVENGAGVAPMSFQDGGMMTLTATGDRVQAAGTIVADPQIQAANAQRARDTRGFPVEPAASDKFAVITLFADQQKAYQILPADDTRRTALVMCMVNPVYIGDEGSISNALGVIYSPTVMPSNVFVLAPSIIASSAVIAFQYTSRQGLYCCSATAAAAQVQCITERFNSGIPIR